MIASTLSVPVCAEDGAVGELVQIEVEKGGLEAEARVTFIQIPGDDEFGLNAAMGYGLTDNLQVRAEIATGGSGIDRDVEAVIFSLRYVIADPDQLPVGLAIQPGLAIDPDTGNIGSETFFVVEHRGANYGLTGNILLTSEAGDWNQWGVAYASRAEALLSQSFTLGLEAGGQLSGENEGSHFIGPVAILMPSQNGPSIGFGMFAGLTDQAPDFQARLTVEMEL